MQITIVVYKDFITFASAKEIEDGSVAQLD